jgi:hypothetical protein
MSTKSTLVTGPNFHLYAEAFDDDHLYLELEPCQFEASDTGVKIEIPLSVWEVIRQYSMADFSFADKSDAEIQAYVEAEVQDRLAAYGQADDRSKRFLNLGGSLVYGRAESPREDQVANGLKHFLQRRADQKKLRSDIQTLRKGR